MPSGSPPEERWRGQQARLVAGSAGRPTSGVPAGQGALDSRAYREARRTRPPPLDTAAEDTT